MYYLTRLTKEQVDRYNEICEANMDDLDKQIIRLAELFGAKQKTPQGEEEAIGIAIGLVGLAIKSLVRIADALEQSNG